MKFHKKIVVLILLCGLTTSVDAQLRQAGQRLSRQIGSRFNAWREGARNAWMRGGRPAFTQYQQQYKKPFLPAQRSTPQPPKRSFATTPKKFEFPTLKMPGIQEFLTRRRIEQQEKDKNLLFEADAATDKKRVQNLIDAGANVNTKYEFGMTPILKLCERNRPFDEEAVEIAELLIKNGANVKAKNKNGLTALHLLNKGKRESNEHEKQLIKLLVKNGADLETKGPFGLTPLFYAVFRDNVKGAKTLLDLGSKIHARIPFSKFPRGLFSLLAGPTITAGSIKALAYAGETGHISGLAMLGALGISGQMGLFTSMYPYMYEEQKRENLELPYDVKELRQDTPLHLAVRLNNIKMVKLLLEKGADPFKMNFRTKNALGYIKSPEMKQLFKDRGILKEFSEMEDVD